MSGKEPPDSDWRERAEEIYHNALSLETETREAYVVRRCAGNPVLYEEVKSLLAASNASGDSFQETVVNKLPRVPATEDTGPSGLPLDSTVMFDCDLYSVTL